MLLCKLLGSERWMFVLLPIFNSCYFWRKVNAVTKLVDCFAREGLCCFFVVPAELSSLVQSMEPPDVFPGSGSEVG